MPHLRTLQGRTRFHASGQRPPEVVALIDEQRCVVLYTPRQTGKTTALLSLAAELTALGRGGGAGGAGGGDHIRTGGRLVRTLRPVCAQRDLR